MNKYFRTEDEIWNTDELPVEEKNSRDLWDGYFIKDNYIYEKSRHWIEDEKYGIEYRRIAKVLKQADTIEELCDEFVDIDNHDYYKISHSDGHTWALSKTTRFYGNYDIRLKEIGQIMGAIYTNRGLIYVAKMNEKGELELL